MPEAPSSWKLQNHNNDAILAIKSSSCPPGGDVKRLKPLRVVVSGGEDDEGTAGRARSFYVYAPPRMCPLILPTNDEYPGGSLRVILAVHGYGAWPRQEIKKWREVASILHAVILAPEGTPTASNGRLGWNAVDCCGDPVANGIDDVDFIFRGVMGLFLDSLFGRDPGRGGVHVIATGFSNGGFMTSLLGLLPGGGRPPWLVGVVPTGGYQYGVDIYDGGGPSTSEGPLPLPVMMHHGGRDAVVRPEGCCVTADSPEGNCPLDIGIRRETCTPVRQAFEMWSGVNGCSSTTKGEDTVNDRLAFKKVHEGEGSPLFTCWKGVECVQPTIFCLWDKEGHSWGPQFPGIDLARVWMEGIYRRAEARGVGVIGKDAYGHHSKKGRLIFSETVFVLFAMLCASRYCFVGRRRKRKMSGEGFAESVA